MLLCSRDLATTAVRPADVEAIDRFRSRLIRMEGGTDFILDAAEEAEGCPLLPTYAAIFWLYAGTRAGVEAARPFIAEAAALQAQANDREQQLFAATEAWAANRPESVIEILESLTAAYPRDQVAAKACEFQYYLTGQHHQAQRFVAHMERIAEANADTSDIVAMRAFAHELAGDYEAARRHAERAIELEYATPWAHHALAHARFVNDEIETGLREQEAFLPTWNLPGATIHGHNSWHLALFHLRAGDMQRCLSLVPGRIWGALPESLTEQTDAISLLWRIEMRGGTADDAMLGEIADVCEPLAEDALVPFAAAHHAWALARAGREDAVGTLLSATRRAAADPEEPRRRIWQEIGLSTVEAGIAAARGDAAGVVTALLDRVHLVAQVGGSDAQDDLWREALVHALIGLGRANEAREVAALFPGNRSAESLIAA